VTCRPIYNALIIGAGNIGAFFDTPGAYDILTHAHAYKKFEGFNLLGFVDTDMGKAKKAVSLWGGSFFHCLEKAFDESIVDVVSVAVPDEQHYEVLLKLSEFPVKCVFAEKPLTKKLEEAEDIVRIYKEKNIGLVVNYGRRFVPEFERIRDDIHQGIYGGYVSGAGFYGKGINHNGSHLIDLLRYFIGEIQDSYVTDYLFDFYDDDPSVSCILTLDNDKKFYLQHIDCNLFSIFELDMFFEKKRIRIKELGFVIEKYDVRESDIFTGYKNMVETGENRTSLGKAMYYAVKNIYDFLTEGAIIKCSVFDGYKAVEVCTEIVKKTII
jgi:predicted dehydrogenase